VPDRLRLVDLVARGSLLVNDGYRTRADELGRPGIPVLRVAEVQQGHLTPTFGDHVLESYRSKIADKVSRPCDVIVTTKGTVGRVALMSVNDSEFVYSPQVCFFRCLDDTIDPRWLYNWFRGPEFTGQAFGVQAQTDMAAYINLADMRAMRLTLPELSEQRTVAATLGALDDKIASNRRVVLSAVQLAQFLLLGDGRAVRLGDVATLDKGVSYKGAGLEDEQSARARPLVNLGNFPVSSGWINRSRIKYYNGDYRARHVVTAGDVVVANTDLTQQRAVLGRAVLVPPGLGPSLFSHHVFAVRFHAREDLRLPLWAQLATPAARDRLIGYATGTTVAALPREALLDFPLKAPLSSQVIVEAEALLEVAWGRERQTSSLIALRDALLPELLSGRIRVPEAGEALESALA